MSEIIIRYLGGLRIEKGVAEQRITLPASSTLQDLRNALASLGLNLDDKEVAYVLDGYGLDHFPLNQPLSSEQVLAIFPLISGG